MTQLDSARRGDLTSEMKTVAAREGVDPEKLMEGLAQGTIVLPANTLKKKSRPVGIGRGLTIKVNANIGTSSDHIDLEEELTKLRICVEAQADTVMDLSTGGDLKAILKAILQSLSPAGRDGAYLPGRGGNGQCPGRNHPFNRR